MTTIQTSLLPLHLRTPFFNILIVFGLVGIAAQTSRAQQCNAPTVVSGFSCGPGAVTLRANSSLAGTFLWYDSPTADTPVRISAPNVITDIYSVSITATATYHVSFSAGSCIESDRTPVEAQVLPSKSGEPQVFNRSRCGPGTERPNANSPTDGVNPIPGTFRWYSAPTGGLLLRTSPTNQTRDTLNIGSISVTTNYWVSFQGRCAESNRSLLTVTVNTPPNPPSASNLIPGSACGSGSGRVVVPLYASNSATRQFNWYKTLAENETPIRSSPLLANEDSYLPDPVPTSSTTYYVALADIVGGCASSRVAVTFTVRTSVASAPTLPTITNGQRCGSGSVSLSANVTGSGSTGFFRFYPSETSGTPLSTNSSAAASHSFSRSINSTTNFFVSYTRITTTTPPQEECVSNRVQVTGFINPLSPPNVQGDFSCGPLGKQTLKATSSSTNGQFRWYDVPVGGTVIQTSLTNVATDSLVRNETITKTYYATFTGTFARTATSPLTQACESARVPVVAVVNPLPPSPVGIPGSNCAGTTTALGANSSLAGMFKWYATATGANILQTSAGGLVADTHVPNPLPASTTDYFVTITDANGCESSRTLVKFSVGETAPNLPNVTPASRCSQGSVTLTAAATVSGTFRWYDVPDKPGTILSSSASTQNSTYSPSVTGSTNFYVTFTDASGCVSPNTVVQATVNSPPTPPTPENGARCGVGTVNLTARSNDSSPGTFRWYSQATGGLPLQINTASTTTTYSPTVSAPTTTFFVTFDDGICGETNPRVAAVAAVNNLPPPPSVVPGSSCAGISVPLGVTSAVAGTFNWFIDGGSSSLQSSAANATTHTFTPNTLSTASFYATITDTNCESNPSATVSFFVSSSPPTVPNVTAPPPRCGPGLVTLAANSGSIPGTFGWFTSPDAIVPFAFSSTNAVSHATTRTPSETTNYYVRFRDAVGCISNRVPVLAVVNPLSTLQPIPVNQQCKSGQVSLEALAANSEPGIFSWFLNATGGSALQTSVAKETKSTYLTSFLVSSATYFVTFNNQICPPPLGTPRTPVQVSITPTQLPTVQAAARCGEGNVALVANSGATLGRFDWWDALTGGTRLSNSGNNTSTSTYNALLKKSTVYYVSFTVGACESPRVPVTASIDLKVNFDWNATCANQFTNFIDKTISAANLAQSLTYRWQFTNNSQDTLRTPRGASPDIEVLKSDSNGDLIIGTYRNPKYKYLSPGDYNVTLKVESINDKNCNESIQKSVKILDTKVVGQSVEWSPKKRDFEWFAHSLVEGNPNDWILNTSISEGKMKTNDATWWTGANGNSYSRNQSSVVNLDKCLDLSGVKRPMISINYWRDFELNYDGAVAQYSTNGGKSWKLLKLDSLTDGGLNWFNSSRILADIGQQQKQDPISWGWTGRANKWNRAAYSLDMIPRKDSLKSVRFRIAMASGSTDGSDDGTDAGRLYQGFAFNDLYIGEKKRQVLVEHFSEPGDAVSDSQAADNYLNVLLQTQETLRGAGNADFTTIRYYQKGRDPNNTDHQLSLDNITDPNQRAAVYGVTRLPSTFMGGRFFDRIDKTNFNYKVLDARSLVSPKFTLALEASSIGTTKLKIKFTIKADTIVNVPVVAQVALIENNVKDNAKYGTRTYQNVLRRLLLGSDATKRDGRYIKSDYFTKAGDTLSITKEIEMDTYISNKNNLMLIGFVQDNLTGERYQSVLIKAPAVEGTINPITAVDDTLEPHSLHMYPNPVATGKLYLGVPQEFLQTGSWKIADQRGVFVEQGDFHNSVEGVKAIDVSRLANGVYFVWMSAVGKTPSYRKLVIINR